MSNFEGIQKNAKGFKPQQRAGDGAGVGKTVAGLWPGQEPVTVFEKANQPVLDTDKTPRTDGVGEGELGLSGQVDHPDRDGQAHYLAGRIAREYRRIVADGASLENLSRDERLQLRNRLVSAVVDGGGQEPGADSASARSTLLYVGQVASLLFGFIDELSDTPDFLRAPKPPTPDSDRVGRIGTDYLKPVSKMEGGDDVTDCPHCHKAMRIDMSAVSTLSGMGTFTCPHCSKKWDGSPSLMLRKDAPANPDLADLKKQLAIQVERLRQIIARGAGHMIESESNRGQRFVTKDAGSGNDPKRLLKHALDNGVAVPFSGADPRSAAEKASGSDRKFQPRA